ncbi:hypothetical protein QAD02_003124 [Eretmocerus hayati]|uniref:Uncharacterized protein n=1 Tax=Eretmocerus hayati TaxID=131215 RepID=A0ACC2NQP4_9HYME|nr:hypothetical protein QAD02_003124 [Eretmocerus hayati]
MENDHPEDNNMDTNSFNIFSGPAISLYQKSYFELMKKSLREGGIVCSQAGTIWMNFEQVQETFRNCKAVFPNVSYAISSVPTYPTGQIGFVLGSSDAVSTHKDSFTWK